MTPQRVHAWMIGFPLTGWACRVLRCDAHPERAPKACVLLILSSVMMVCAVVMALWK